MPTSVYREACLHELRLALRLARGHRWLGTLEGESETRLREWVHALGRGVSPEDRPTVRMLPRAPQAWAETLSGRAPIALTGLDSLEETRPGSFAESSSAMKGASLLRALEGAEGARVLLLLPDAHHTRTGGPLTDLLARADVRIATDVTVPLPEGSRLQPLPLHAPAVHPIEEPLRERVRSLRVLVEAARSGPVAQSPECWSARVALGRLEVLLGEVTSAERTLGECATQTACPAARAEALETLGDLGLVQGDVSGAAALYQRSYHHARRAGDAGRAEAALLRLGEVSALLGNYRDALRYYELVRGPGSAPPVETQRIERAIEAEQVRLSRAAERGDPEERAQAASALGHALALAGRHDEAAEHLEDAARAFAEAGDETGQAAALEDSSLAWARRGGLEGLRPEAARELGRAVELIGASVGALGSPAALESGPGAAEGAHVTARTEAHLVLLRTLAQLAEEQGHHERAARHRELAARLESGVHPPQ